MEKTNNFLNKLALATSVIFSPLTLVPLVIILVLLNNKLTPDQLFTNALIILITVLIIFLMFLYLRLTKRISDWDVQIRQQRFFFNSFAIIVGLLMMIFLFHFGTSTVADYILFVYICFLFFTIITFFWKISGHVGSVTLAVITLFRFLGWSWWWTAILIPLVAWARIYRKNHTLAQTAGVVILDVGIYFLFKLLGVI